MVDVTVDGNGSGANAPEQELAPPMGAASAPASFDSPLLSLRARRAEIVDNLWVDLRVPRWDNPKIFVRYAPVSAVKLNTAIERRRKEKGDDWSLLANADMLVDSCIGIYGELDDGTQISLRDGDPSGKWTTFDPDLAKALGVEVERAVDTVRSLYLTEGDLIDASNKLFRWSGIAGDEADEAF